MAPPQPSRPADELGLAKRYAPFAGLDPPSLDPSGSGRVFESPREVDKTVCEEVLVLFGFGGRQRC